MGLIKSDIKEWEFDKLSKEEKKKYKIKYIGKVPKYPDSPISGPVKFISIPKYVHDFPVGRDPLFLDVFREFYIKETDDGTDNQ